MVGLFVGIFPLNSNADDIEILNFYGGNGEVGGGSMYLGHLDDGYKMIWDKPPGGHDASLRTYTKGEINGKIEKLSGNYRPSNAPNDWFNIKLDVYGSGTVNSANNYVRFELQDGPDEARPYYHWEKTFVEGLGQFSNGTLSKSGIWDLSKGNTNLPSYNLTGVSSNSGNYAYLDVLPSDSPVHPSQPTYIISTETDGDGTINPNSLEGLVAGEEVNFNIIAGDYKHIKEIKRNEKGIYLNKKNSGIAFTNCVFNVVSNETVFAGFVPSKTEMGTFHYWYTDRGITNNFEEIDTTIQDCGFTGRDMYLMGVDDLFDPEDRYRGINIDLVNGIPIISIPNSKTDRRYTIYGTQDLKEPDWKGKTNSLGTGGDFI